MKKSGVMQNVVRSLAAVVDAEAQSPARKSGKLEEGGAASASDNPTGKKGPFESELYSAMEAFDKELKARVIKLEAAAVAPTSPASSATSPGSQQGKTTLAEQENRLHRDLTPISGMRKRPRHQHNGQ